MNWLIKLGDEARGDDELGEIGIAGLDNNSSQVSCGSLHLEQQLLKEPVPATATIASKAGGLLQHNEVIGANDY